MNLGLGIALLIASIAAYWGWNNYLDEREAFSTFKGVAAGLAAAQAKRILDDKAKHDADIKTALAERDAARQRLLDAQRARTQRLPSLPISPEGTTVVCFNRSGFESSIRAFVGGVQDLVIEGDESIIDNRAWLSAWPK
jgi:hypothetical protein